MNTDVIIIKGAPGSGKSETADVLSANFPKGVKIEVDYLRGMVIFIDWEDLDEHIKSLEIAANLTLDFLKFNYKPVIVIDTFSMGKEYIFINTLLDNRDNLNIKIFGLYVNEDELKKRLGERSSEQYRNFILSNEVNKEVINSKDENLIIIDTTDKTAEETSNTILRSL